MQVDDKKENNMKFVKHPQHSRWLGAPIGWDHDDVPCGALSIKDTLTGAYPSMESSWEPEGFEAARLALGEADIRLAIVSTAHPPVSMIVYPKLELDRDTRRVNLMRHLRELAGYAAQEGFSILAQSGDGVFVSVIDQRN